jgi:nucleotide-binding universal stress UspA family protein
LQKKIKTLTAVQALVKEATQNAHVKVKIHVKILSGDVKSVVLALVEELNPSLVIVGSDSLLSKKSFPR